MLKLTPPNDQVYGCPINFPDTAFFDDKGRISDIVKTDKEGFISVT